MMSKNKKGTDKLLSLYWFLVLTLVAGGVIAMVLVYYGAPYDIREIESTLFAEKIADCISNKGVISNNILNGDIFKIASGEDFTNRCGITFNVEDGYGDINEPQYFYEVYFYKVTDTLNPAFNFSYGNTNLKPDCFIKKENGKDYVKLAVCREERFYSVNNKGDQYLIKIFSVIGKSDKNVKK